MERASFDDKLKDALRQLVRAHLARVDEEAGKVGSGAPTESALSKHRRNRLGQPCKV